MSGGAQLVSLVFFLLACLASPCLSALATLVTESRPSVLYQRNTATVPGRAMHVSRGQMYQVSTISVGL